jgi:hypothetical protein
MITNEAKLAAPANVSIAHDMCPKMTKPLPGNGDEGILSVAAERLAGERIGQTLIALTSKPSNRRSGFIVR